MKLSASPDFLESIANDPRIRPYIGGEGEVRAGDTWASSIGLEWECGGVVFMRVKAGVYDAHLLFLPGSPGVLAKCREALRYLFTRTAANKVIGAIAVDNARARRIAQAAGLECKGIRDGYAHYALTAREWIRAKE